MGQLLAATAARDRAASRPLSVSGTAFVAQVAVGTWKMVAARSVGFGVVLEKRRTFGFQQGAEGTKPRSGVLTLTADVGINEMSWPPAGGETWPHWFPKMKNREPDLYGLPVKQTQAKARKQV